MDPGVTPPPRGTTAGVLTPVHQRAPEKHKAAKPPREERALAQDRSALRAVGLALGEGLNSLLKHDLHTVYKSHKQSLMDFRELNAIVYPAPTSSSRCSPRPGTLRNGAQASHHGAGVGTPSEVPLLPHLLSLCSPLSQQPLAEKGPHHRGSGTPGRE